MTDGPGSRVFRFGECVLDLDRGTLERRGALVPIRAKAFGLLAHFARNAEYRRHFPGFADSFGGIAFSAGVVDVTGARQGAALWLPPGGARPAAGGGASRGQPRGATQGGDLRRSRNAGRAAPPPNRPGTCRSSACTRGRRAANLEATSARSVPLYRRHCFQIIGMVGSPGYPQIFAMWRPARA